jgi:molecular chaperone HtpG
VSASERIVFDVETSRILQILSAEIYDSPKAILRENTQNAYDAILMRCTAQGLDVSERRIQITIGNDRLTVTDDGIGMTEEVLRQNFWKAGSSGKRSDLAQRSGVIGTFGIGALANFGVCTSLRVETRHIDSNVTLISGARRDDLKIAQDCISFDRVEDEREPGTVIVAELDPSFSIDEKTTIDYLRQYVRFLPVPVYVNDTLISLETFDAALTGTDVSFKPLASRAISGGNYAGLLETALNAQSRVRARLTEITLSGNRLNGGIYFVQQGGQTLGFRNLFGLAPIPVSAHYGFGGFVNLDILHPTAGREALSRDSIQHVTNMLNLIEAEVSKDLSNTDDADQNQQFQNYILSHNLIALAHNLKITVLPEKPDVRLGEINDFEPEKSKHFYAHREPTILKRFASEQANLFHVSQANPRRNLQLRYLKEISRIPEVPEKPIVDRVPASALSLEETIFLIRIRGVLLDQYLMPDVDVEFATISHGVAFQVDGKGDALRVAIARDMPAVKMVLELYRTAREAFDPFVQDFVREQLYQQIRDHVPSSTKLGRDALFRRIQQNKELFRVDYSDYGEAEALLADYLAGKVEFSDVVRAVGGGSRTAIQRQEVRQDQVGTVEQEFPDIVESAPEVPPTNEFEPAPPILREEVTSDMKVLTVANPHPKLNNFQMFLALSDRVNKREGEFLRWPHTTKVIWGSHRVIYIFTDATAELSLYYDIELREPLGVHATGGAMFPTTTIITSNRIYVPVPQDLERAFQIIDHAKEFFVRFDTVP